MILEFGLMLAFLIVFGILVSCIAKAIVDGQSKNRTEMERVREEFERIVERLGEEEGGPS